MFTFLRLNRFKTAAGTALLLIVASTQSAFAVAVANCGNWYSPGGAAIVYDQPVVNGCVYDLTYTLGLGPFVPVDFEIINPQPGLFLFDSSGSTVHNQTPIAWDDYHFELGVGAQSTFQPLPAPWAAFQGPTLSSPFELTSQSPTSLAFANAIVPPGGGAVFTIPVMINTPVQSLTIRQYYSVARVPEPGVVGLLLFGLLGVACHRVRKKVSV